MADPSCRLLLIDSDPADAELASKLLSQSLSDCQLVTVTDAVGFAQQLAAGGFSAVISEQSLGWATGTDVLASFSRQYPNTRTILFTNTLPSDIHKVQQESGLSAYAQKSSAGFLHLPELVRSALQSEYSMDGGSELWSQTVKRVDEPAMTILADGRVVEANTAAAAVLGYQQAEELAGLRVQSLLELDHNSLSEDEDLQTRLESLVNGLADPVDARATPMKDVKKIGRRRLMIWPIPESSRLAVLYHGHTAAPSQADNDSEFKEQYEQLLYAVSHDLQEPLQLVTRHAALLLDAYRDGLDETGTRFIHNLADNAQLMQSMLDDLLEYSRIGRLGPIITEVDLDEVVDEVLTLYRPKLRELGGQVRKAGLPTVMADRSQMMRLFQNLVGNAIKFHGDKKPVITISAAVNEDSWELAVKDNGIGIEPDQLEHIFTMFKRLHPQDDVPGNGMGLALCERIVKAHGGRIWARSRGKHAGGVAFHFTLDKTGSEQNGNHEDDELEEGKGS